MQDSQDWMIDANGFYIVTRSFLIRRGFCCANQWRNSPTWKPLPAEAVRVMTVSPRAIEGARKALTHHEEQLRVERQTKAAFHQAMILHYRLLLECWEEAKE